MKRLSLVPGLVLLLGLILVTPALAGGWAVITLDALPAEIEAGKPFEIGFMVRQHGVTPASDLTPTIHARLGDGGKSLTFTADEKGAAGHYVAALTFPEKGEWQWSIEAFGGNQPMPALTVAAASLTTEKTVQAMTPRTWLQWGTVILGAAGILVGLAIAFRRKTRWAVALVLAGALVSGGSIVSAAAQTSASPPQAAKAMPADPSISQVELGRNLFIAKGCVICHSHNETNPIREFGVDIGPELSHFKSSPEYLRLWLNDPSSVKPATKMPTLGLSAAEIEALIEFLNDD
jgi:cytochrome c2